MAADRIVLSDNYKELSRFASSASNGAQFLLDLPILTNTHHAN